MSEAVKRPQTIHLTQEELDDGYEKNTGTVIIEAFRERAIDPKADRT